MLSKMASAPMSVYLHLLIWKMVFQSMQQLVANFVYNLPMPLISRLVWGMCALIMSAVLICAITNLPALRTSSGSAVKMAQSRALSPLPISEPDQFPEIYLMCA